VTASTERTGGTPYYEADGITIFHGDALELAADLPQVDSLILDPPFFMPAYHYAARSEWARAWGDTAILRRWWGCALDGLSPRLGGTGSAFVFCDDESYPVFYPECYVRFPALSALVWDKGRIGMGKPWRHAHEFILHARRADAKWRGSAGESDVLKFTPTPTVQRWHPVSKPLGLLDKLIRVTTDEGDLVCDPFMGGGSTLDAAKQANRRAIGIEIEERYCEIAARRLSQGVLDLQGRT
jgi:site-specific DNA-methyltransferase (adenine-specific)